MVLAGAIAGTADAASLALADRGAYPYCQIADRVTEPTVSLSLGYTPAEKVADTRFDFGFVEERARADFAFFRTRIGEFDFGATLDTWFNNGDGLKLPDVFGRLSADVTWDWRTRDGLTFRAEAFPGFYTDYEDLDLDDGFIPFSLSGIQAFNPRVSGRLGAYVYPGFDRAFEPIVGVRWSPFDDLVVDAFFPRSRVAWRCIRPLTLVAGYEFNRTWEFAVAEDDPRDRFIYSERRWYVGADIVIDDFLHLTGRLGWLHDRSVDFTRNFIREDVDAAVFASAGVAAFF